MRTHALGELFRPGDIAVDQRDLGRTRENQRNERSRRCSTGTQNHDVLAGRIEPGVALERLKQPPAIGVVAHELAVDAVDGVDRTRYAGRRGDFIAEVENRGLERHGHAETDERKRTDGGHQAPEADLIGYLQRDVHPIEAERLVDGVVHDG